MKHIKTFETSSELKAAYVYPEKLPFFERLYCTWDFDSQIKSIWLTGYILITWEWGDWKLFRKTLDIGWYKSGSYE